MFAIILIHFHMLEFIGHLHPVLVHLPIGILFIGVFMMLYEHYSGTDLKTPISLAFILGSIGAVVACIAGWLLSNSGEYDAALILKHQWTGIATSLTGGLMYFIKQNKKLGAIVLVILLILTGHFGATLTHGENYLWGSDKKETLIEQDSLNKETKKITQIITNGKDSIKIVKHNKYQDDIMPILKLRCYNCHSALKQKNLLRLDSEAFIKKGGKTGMILMAGNILKSPLYAHLILPLEDEKHMPPKGKHQLSENEIAIIQEWIKTGASFEDQIDTLSIKETPIKLAPTKIIVIKKVDTIVPVITNKISDPQPDNTAAISVATIASFKQQNIILSNLSETAPFVMANFVNIVPFDNAALLELQKIEKQLVILKLTNLPIKDNDVKMLVNLKKMRRLNLENTAITNECIVYLKQLPELEQLNLYGTNISDEGLKQLASFKKLSVLYLWKTKVTANGVEQFKKERPDVKVEIGNFKFQKK